MTEIIPAIIARDFSELTEQMKKVEPYVNWVQLDIMDGQFVPGQTWQDPAELRKIQTNLNLEAHLMISRLEERIGHWINSGVKRIIFHWEAASPSVITELVKRIKQAGLEVGLALNPQTPIEVIEGLISQLDLVLVMTVEPGQGGQKLIEATLKKVRALRQRYPQLNIEVDGGINLKTADQAIKAGANLLASGTGIFKSENIKETIDLFKEKLTKIRIN